MKGLRIHPVRAQDKPAWAQLWKGYQTFYEVSLPEAVTEANWARFFDAYEPMHALVAEHDGGLVGLVHYLFHRSTWMVAPTCYLQDLFAVPQVRGLGVGGPLIEAVYDCAREAGLTRVYWNTHETNATARRLYDRVAVRSGFIQYRRDL